MGGLPRVVAEPYVREGLLEEVLVGARPQREATLVLLYPSSGQVPRKVAAFRDFLVKWLAAAPGTRR